MWLIDVKDAVMCMFREEYIVLEITLNVQCGILYENDMIVALGWINLTVNPVNQWMVFTITWCENAYYWKILTL